MFRVFNYGEGSGAKYTGCFPVHHHVYRLRGLLGSREWRGLPTEEKVVCIFGILDIVLGLKINEAQFVLLFIYWLANSVTPSGVNSWKIKVFDFYYTWCSSTIRRGYADRLAESTLNYTNASRCFGSIIVVFVLAGELYVHNEQNMLEVIVRHIPSFLCFLFVHRIYGQE